MADDKKRTTADLEEGEKKSSRVGRRDYLKLTGAGALAALGGSSIVTGDVAAVTEGGPTNQSEWTLAFEDNFDSGSLDTSKWSVGFGWGLETNGSPERIVGENVNVSNGVLSLKGTHDGSDYKAGAVNTKGKAYFGPGSYWEAKIKMPKRVGFLPAFWSKPNDESWPPEIDFVELFQTDGDWGDVSRSHHNIHYSSSTSKGDSSTHQTYNSGHDASVDLTKDFHIYGCEWQSDRVVHYLDGEQVAVCTDGTIMQALRNGAPFYMMLNIHIDRVGTADPNVSWGETMDVEWVRVWEYGGSGGSSDGGSSTSDGSSTSGGDHYLWVRSADGSTAEYEFTASGGNIGIDNNERASGEDDEYVSSDGTRAGGTVGDGDGFWFDGEITDFTYTGSVETYIDDQYVDPDSLAADTDTQEPTDEHYVWFRSASGTARYAFTTSGSDIRIDENERSSGESDEWVASDGSTAGGETANGTVSDGDGFWYTGEITDLNYEGSLEVFVDNQSVDPDSLVDPNSSGPDLDGQTDTSNDGGTSLPHTLTIDGSRYSGWTSYNFTVTEELASTDSVDQGDTIDGTSARGAVGGGSNSYQFSGSLSRLALDGDADVSIDGTPLSLLLVERSSDSSGFVHYIVETAGDVVPATVPDGHANSSDKISGGKVFGGVTSGTDAYWIVGGDVVDVTTYGGDVVATVNGTVTDFTDL